MARLSADSWEDLRAEYRTGLFSNCQLAEKYGISEGALRKRAKQEDWGKDLSQQVQAEINSRLQKYEPQNAKYEAGKTRTLDSEIVEAAAASGVLVIQRHRRILDKGQSIVDGLMSRIEANDEELPMDKQVALVKELSVASKNLMELERKAWNLDTVQETTPLEERLKKIHAQAA